MAVLSNGGPKRERAAVIDNSSIRREAVALLCLANLTTTGARNLNSILKQAGLKRR